MEVSNNFNRYDSTIQKNQELYSNKQVKKSNSIKIFLEAFKIDLSAKALSSKEINDPSINFPIFNEEVLQYSENLDLVFKP